ncbi:MAG: hypothetical protein HC854_02240 [Flavobacterium sp.]|nr:hypothetical protein [Flavobacterium sp.]
MSRHQGNDKSNPGSGRQGGFKKSSNSRGNAPIRKTPSNSQLNQLEKQKKTKHQKPQSLHLIQMKCV